MNKLTKFPIKVINKFDEDKKDIRVWHNGKSYILRHLKCRESQLKQKGFQAGEQRDQKKPYHARTFKLAPDESLVIELAKEVGDFDEFTKDVFFELPFIADYKLSFEIRKGDLIEPVPVDRPITYLTRNTMENQQIPTEEGKTILRIPGDQRAWRLEISSPKNWKEHIQTKNLLIEYCHNSGGTGDSASVGDNGP